MWGLENHSISRDMSGEHCIICLTTIEICGFRTARPNRRAGNGSQHTLKLAVIYDYVKYQDPKISDRIIGGRCKYSPNPSAW